MANAILTPSIIANEALMRLENSLVLAKLVNMDYSKEYTGTVGDSISVRRPIRMATQSDNLDVSSFNTDVEDANVLVSMDKTETAKFTLTPQEMSLEIGDNRIQNIVEAAVVQLRDRVETEVAKMYSSVWNYWGTPGTRPATFLTLAEAGATMTDMAIPLDPRCAVHSPMTAAYLADSLKAVQVERSKVTTALEKVSTGHYAGFDHYSSVHMPRHVVGAQGGTPLVDGGSQAVTYAASKATNSQSLNTDGWSTSVTGLLKKGDVFTIAGVFSVNPISKQSTGRLQCFTVLADADSDGAGDCTLSIAPAIIITGPYQTVSATAADNAAIVVKTGTAGASYEQSLLFHKNAFLLVSRPLNVDGGAGVKVSTKSGNRMSITCTETVDFNTLQRKYRLDVLFGTKAIYPDLALRLTA